MSLTKLGWALMMGTALKAGAHPMTEKDEQRLLRAIAEVETGWTDLMAPCPRIGKYGERSAWQLTETVWRRYETAPFYEASRDAGAAMTVATLHLRWLVAELKKRDLIPTPFLIALGWNGGPRAWKTMSERVRSYASRVRNIHQERCLLETAHVGIFPGSTPGKVWLRHTGSGEAGEFPAQEVAGVMHDREMLAGYFRANF